MFDFKFTFSDNTAELKRKADQAAFRNFNHAAASIAKDAKASIQTADGPSAPGTPPHTQRGAFLRRAIRYAADKTGAVIGPMASVVGESAQPMEFGGRYKRQDYPPRPFMFPALERALPRFAGDWEGSIG